jgi:hypothetical protein
MSTQYAFGKIVTSGLVLALDAADRNSYPGSGTTWNDMSGNGYTGSLVNGPTFNSANGGSIQFDGTNDNVGLPTNIPLNNVSQFTYNSFLTFSSKASFGNAFFSYGTTSNFGNDILFFWDTSSNSLGFQINKGADGTATYVFSPPSQFINLCVVYDGSQSTNATKMIVYINGVQIILNFNTYTVPTSTATLSNALCMLGEYACATNAYTLNGKIATTQIYNRTLSASEVLQNYNAQKSRFNLK